MVVAVKQKRSSRRQEPKPTGARDPEPIPGPRQPAAVAPAPAYGTASPKGPGAQAPLLTKIGTPIAFASLIFDGDWYQNEYPDVAAASMDPVRYYFDNGSREGRNPNRYFDTNWYASNNPDVAAAGLNPFLHYLLYGAREGRKPAP